MQFATKNKDGEHFQRVLTEIDQDSPSVDAFHRLRTSSPTTLFDSQLQYNNVPFIWQSQITGSGTDTHDPNASNTVMAVTANAADSVTRQTRLYYRYQPGKSQLINTTFVLGAAVAGVVKRVGYFDDENGIFLEQDGTNGLNLVIRSNVTGSPIDNKISQTDWNVDRVDGSKNKFNKSSQLLDITTNEILYIDLQWLSAGTVRIAFDLDGEEIIVHKFKHANVISTAFMTTANLPVRYEITTDGTNGGSMIAICSSISSEGGFTTDFGFPYTASNADGGVSVTGADVPILTIRPKLTFNGLVNRSQIITELVALLGTQPAAFKLVHGGTLTGASFSSVHSESMVEFDSDATAISGGFAVISHPVEKAGVFDMEKDLHLPLSLDISGAHPVAPLLTDNLTVVGSKIAANSTINASLNWIELR